MRLFELTRPDLDKEPGEGIYDPNQDSHNQAHLGDTRKKRLTLRDINRLKKMRALKDLEAEQRSDLVARMYGPAPGGDDGGFGGPGF